MRFLIDWYRRNVLSDPEGPTTFAGHVRASSRYLRSVWGYVEFLWEYQIRGDLLWVYIEVSDLVNAYREYMGMPYRRRYPLAVAIAFSEAIRSGSIQVYGLNGYRIDDEGGDDRE